MHKMKEILSPLSATREQRIGMIQLFGKTVRAS